MIEFWEQIADSFRMLQKSAEIFGDESLEFPFFSFEKETFEGVDASFKAIQTAVTLPQNIEAITPMIFPEIPLGGSENLFDRTWDFSSATSFFSTVSGGSKNDFDSHWEQALYENGGLRQYHIHKEAPQIAIEFSGAIHKDVDVDALLREMKTKLQEDLSAETTLQYYY